MGAAINGPVGDVDYRIDFYDTGQTTPVYLGPVKPRTDRVDQYRPTHDQGLVKEKTDAFKVVKTLYPYVILYQPGSHYYGGTGRPFNWSPGRFYVGRYVRRPDETVGMGPGVAVQLIEYCEISHGGYWPGLNACRQRVADLQAKDLKGGDIL